MSTPDSQFISYSEPRPLRPGSPGIRHTSSWRRHTPRTWSTPPPPVHTRSRPRPRGRDTGRSSHTGGRPGYTTRPDRRTPLYHNLDRVRVPGLCQNVVTALRLVRVVPAVRHSVTAVLGLQTATVSTGPLSWCTGTGDLVRHVRTLRHSVTPVD